MKKPNFMLSLMVENGDAEVVPAEPQDFADAEILAELAFVVLDSPDAKSYATGLGLTPKRLEKIATKVKEAARLMRQTILHVHPS